MVDKSYRGRISEKIPIEDLIPIDIYNSKNEEKSWEYKEYPEFDINFVCISKDGTLGEIYKVGDLYIGLPNSKGKKIINEGKRPEESKWKREEPPIEFRRLWNKYKKNMAREKNGQRRTVIKDEFCNEREALVNKYSDFVNEEFHKREYGIFIKIDEEVHYFTGEYWMFLSHYYLVESNMYGYFRVVAMEAMWHWEACRADSRVWGEIRGKGRRTSWSVESSSMALNTFTVTRYAEIPIVSERSELAKKLFKTKIVSSFEYYPIYFKPLIALPNEKPSSNLEIEFETDEAETSIIDYYPTKDTAYDSLKVKNISINDEIGKWIDCSLGEFISRHSRCHTEGGATGRFGSTAGDYAKGGGKEFEQEFLNANAQKRNELGRTKNGLVSFFIDICYTYTQPVSYFDQWGYSVVKDPVEPILNEKGELISIGAETDWQIDYETKKSSGNKRKVNAFLRDMPRTVAHMFRNEGGIHNDFNIQNLNDHEDYLKNIPDVVINEKIFRGNLVFTGDKFDSPVEWRNNPNGRIITTWIPEMDLQNKSILRDYHGKKLKMPVNNHIGCLGIDSYDISRTVNDNGSNGACAGYSKFNMAGAPTNSFFLKYTNRPDKATNFYDDMICIMQFYSMYALIESNKPRLLEYMKDNGYRGYSMDRPDKKWRNLSDFEKEVGGIYSSKQTNKDCASLLKDYIDDFIGGQDLENDCKCYFLDMIQEFKVFNVNNRTKFDLSVAAQLALMGSQYKVKQRKSLNIGSENNQGLSISAFGA